MTFMCMAYEEEAKLNELSPEEWQALRHETLSYVEVLKTSGHLIAAHPLRSARTASTLRVRGGALSVLDGPFAETKEQIGGFFLIDAADKEEAIALASRWPGARIGTIEVRPVDDGLSADRRYADR
jgi:hypothetical protein